MLTGSSCCYLNPDGGGSRTCNVQCGTPDIVPLASEIFFVLRGSTIGEPSRVVHVVPARYEGGDHEEDSRSSCHGRGGRRDRDCGTCARRAALARASRLVWPPVRSPRAPSLRPIPMVTAMAPATAIMVARPIYGPGPYAYYGDGPYYRHRHYYRQLVTAEELKSPERCSGLFSCAQVLCAARYPTARARAVPPCGRSRASKQNIPRARA